MNRVDAEEGAKRLDIFRSLRLEGDYCFRFELIHKPRFGKNHSYLGTMWGSWNADGPVTRFRLESQGDSLESRETALEFIIQNGPNPGVWRREWSEDAFARIEGAALFEPIIPGLVHTFFDLQMPFIYWEEFTYEGPRRVGMSRVAQRFLMLPPESDRSVYEEQGIAGVRVGIDDIYNALWSVETMDAEGSVLRSFNVESFKRVQKQYIVRVISIQDADSRDRTTFSVEAASVGLRFKPDIFDAAANAEPPVIPESMFQQL